MFKQEMSATPQLLLGQRDSKPKMFESFSSLPIILKLTELRMVEILVHEGEPGARWGKNDPIWLCIIHEAHGNLAIGSIGKIPRLPIGFKGCKIQRSKSFKIQTRKHLASFMESPRPQ